MRAAINVLRDKGRCDASRLKAFRRQIFVPVYADIQAGNACHLIFRHDRADMRWRVTLELVQDKLLLAWCWLVVLIRWRKL